MAVTVPTSTAKIYSALKSLGRPSLLPGLWRGLSETDSPFFWLGPDFQRTIEGLRAQFGEQELRKAGVIQQGPGGTWELPPSLRGDHLLLVYPQCKPFTPQLVTATEVLPEGRAPYRALLQDRRLHKLVQQNSEEVGNWHYLAITPTLAETVIFWRLGLPAVPLAALAELDAEGLETLKRLLGEIRPGAARKDGASSLSLVLVTWSLATWDFSVQPGIDAVSDLLRDLQDHLKLDLRTMLWQPGNNARKCLQTALRYQDIATLRKAILFGYERETEVLATIKQAPFECHDEPQSYADSISALMASRTEDLSTQQQLRKQHRQYSDRQLIQPLLNLAERTEDPVVATLLVNLSHSVRSSELVAAKLFSPFRLTDVPGVFQQEEHKALKEEQQTLSKQQMALCQAISERTRNTARTQASV